MSTFIVLNGHHLHAIVKETISDAITWAQNYCDHSYSVRVEQVDSVSAKSLKKITTKIKSK